MRVLFFLHQAVQVEAEVAIWVQELLARLVKAMLVDQVQELQIMGVVEVVEHLL
jgi:hypothetical protein